MHLMQNLLKVFKKKFFFVKRKSYRLNALFSLFIISVSRTETP